LTKIVQKMSLKLIVRDAFQEIRNSKIIGLDAFRQRRYYRLPVGIDVAIGQLKRGSLRFKNGWRGWRGGKGSGVTHLGV
jgi:hypothetical protein